MASTPRKALIAKIHVARKHLRLEEDDYRNILIRLTGQSSAADLDVAELEAVVAEFRRLGWEEPAEYRRKKTQPTHVRMIYGLWLQLKELGALEDFSKDALRSFVKRQTGVSAPEFLRNAAEANPVIEPLKQMIKRARAKAGKVS